MPCVARPDGNGLCATSVMRQALPKLPVTRARIAAGLDQLEVAERAFEDVGRPFEARSREVAGDDGVAGAEAHLHGEQQRALGMRLHVAAELAVGDGEGMLQPAGVEAHQLAEGS